MLFKENAMAGPSKLNLKIYQGSTFRETLRWESSTKVYVPITQITKTAPVVVTAAAHGLKAGWRCKVTGVSGMKEINMSDYATSTGVTTDTVTFNQINATGYTTYTSGGILEYNQPVDLTGFSARMQIRAKLDDATVIKELTTTNGGIIIDNTNSTITVLISATDTAALTFSNGVYSLELVSSGGEVTALIAGTISLVKEVTR